MANDDDFQLAPRWLQVAAASAEAVRRIWHRMPAPAKAVTWMAVWWLGQRLNVPLMDSGLIGRLRELGRP